MSGPRQTAARTNPAARVVDTAVGPVEYELTEGRAPVVMACHAGVGGVDQARLLLDWLDPAAYRTLSVSRPGYLGTPLSSGRGPEAQADMFAALLDVLDIERAAVVTLSSGGPSGYLLAARHPGRVAALVAISSVSGHHEAPPTAGPVARAIFMSQAGQRLTAALARRRPASLLRQLFRGESHLNKRQVEARVEYTLATPDALAFIRAFLATMNPYRARMAGTDNDTERLARLTRLPLHQVRCPTLVVHGTHDADVMFHHGVDAHERIPDAERHWLDLGSHLGFWLSPEAPGAQHHAREFLARHHPSRAD